MKRILFLITLFFVSCAQLMGHSIANAITQERPIVVVVCSYNNGKWSENTLSSIFSQTYTNFRVIIVDDCSTDDNVGVIQNFIDKHNLSDRVTFIKNDVRHRKLFNLYRVLYECHDDEIVFMVDGDDSIHGTDVFTYINDIYKDESVWFTYGQYRNVPAYEAERWGFKEKGYCRPVPKRIQNKFAYRQYSFIYMHPRSFRAWLFKLVKLEDLIADTIDGFEGDFYPAANDVAMYFPMVEMAHSHIKFISDVLYIRNLYSEIVGFKVDRRIQAKSAREIRKKPSYHPLFKPQKYRIDSYEHASADLFLLCQNDLDTVDVLLRTMQEKTSNLETIYVFFRNTPENKKICRCIKNSFPNVIFVPFDGDGGKGLKRRLLEHLSIAKNEHILVTTDTCSIMTHIDVSHYIFWLEKTFAHRFYLNRHAACQTPKFISLTKDVCAWKITTESDQWKGINVKNDSFLCRKAMMYQEMKKLNFTDIHDFLKQMHYATVLPRVGLFPYNEIMRSME